MNDILIAQANSQGRPVPSPPSSGGGTAPMAPLPGKVDVTPPSGRTTFSDPTTSTNNTDLMIGGGIVVVLGIVFYVAKRGLTRHLIERKASVGQADRTGWMLWIMLMSATLTGIATYLGRQTLFAKSFALTALVNSSATMAMAGFATIFLVSMILFIVYYRSARAG